MAMLDNNEWFIWLSIASGVMFIGTLILSPVIIVKLPQDFFSRTHYENDRDTDADAKTSIGRKLWRISRSILGILLIIAGILMLFLPGQGVLTLLFGLSLIDFPGKSKLINRVISKMNTQSVIKHLNSIRRFFGAPPLHQPVTSAD